MEMEGGGKVCVDAVIVSPPYLCVCIHVCVFQKLLAPSRGTHPVIVFQQTAALIQSISLFTYICMMRARVCVIEEKR